MPQYYSGLSGVLLPVPKADLGGGVSLEVTYGHIFAPCMMAFKPAPPNGHHPGRVRGVGNGGFAIDIHCQLSLPGEHSQSGFEEVKEVVRLIATLMRIRLGPGVRAATVSSVPISVETAQADEGQIWALEVLPSPLLDGQAEPVSLSDDHIDWLRANWVHASKLAKGNRDFQVLLDAYSACSWTHSTGLALVELWGALQRVFTQSHSESKLRLSVLLASYLERPGIERRKLSDRISKLYDARSKGAHGSKSQDIQTLADSANVAARTITKLIEDHAVPTHDDLFDMLFGV